MSADPTFWSAVIGWLFLVTNAGRLLAYFPQIIAAARCESGARSVSILTWGYFAFAHLTALLYAIVVLRDSRSMWIFGGNLVVTVILVVIVSLKRRNHQRASDNKLPPTRKRECAPLGASTGRKGKDGVSPRFRRSELVMTNAGGQAGAGGKGQIVMRFGLQAVTLRAAR